MDCVEKGLIDLIRKHPLIFKNNHPLYKKAQTKEQIWSEIATQLNISISTAKRKWRSIRDYYYQLKRNKEVHPSYKTSWRHYNSLSFLDEQYILKPNRIHNGGNISGSKSWCSPSSSPLSFLSPAESELDYILSNSQTLPSDPLALHDTDVHNTNQWNFVSLINIEEGEGERCFVPKSEEKSDDESTFELHKENRTNSSDNDVSNACSEDLTEDDKFSNSEFSCENDADIKPQINNISNEEIAVLEVQEEEKETSDAKFNELKIVPKTLHKDVLSFLNGTFQLLQPDDRKLFEKRIVDLTMKYRFSITLQ